MKLTPRGIAVAALAGAALAGVYFAREILVPFLLAGMIAYTLDPLVAALERRGISRGYGAILVMATLALMVVGLAAAVIPELIEQTSRFSERLPDYRLALLERLEPLEQYLQARHPDLLASIQARIVAAANDLLPAAAGWAVSGLKGIMSSTMRLLVSLLTVVIIPVFTYYLLADAPALREAITGLVPRHLRDQVGVRAAAIDTVLRAWLKGQLTVALVLAVIYAVGLTALGVPLGLVIGLIGGLANIIPYLGLVVGFFPAALLSFLDTGGWVGPVLVAGVFAAGQVLEGTVISPRVIGGGLGLPPAIVLLAVLTGGQLFGFTGLLLAVPATAAGLVLLRDLRQSIDSSHTANQRRRSGLAPPVRRRRPLL